MQDNELAQDHVLVLLKSRNHYDGIASLNGFLNTSYYCHQCDCAFNTDDPDNHSCHGQKCRACGGNPCPDRYNKPTLLCVDCNGLFRGPSLVNSQAPTPCPSFERLPRGLS